MGMENGLVEMLKLSAYNTYQTLSVLERYLRGVGHFFHQPGYHMVGKSHVVSWCHFESVACALVSTRFGSNLGNNRYGTDSC